MLSHFVRKLSALVESRRPKATARAGGLVWLFAPGAGELLGEGGPDLDAWEAAGVVEAVKRNLQRTISKARLPAGTVYVKECRANTPRAWCREILRPAKARLEFENALALRRLGIPAVEPLACGTTAGRLPGVSVLITRDQPGTTSLLTFLEERLPALPAAEAGAIRRQVVRTLAVFLARMHDKGVSHPDPHPGNLLVDFPPSRVLHYTLTDLHAVRFGKPLTWGETRANLVLMNRWFQVRAGRADRARFWRAYLAARATLPADFARGAAMARELEVATEASNHRFWAHRTGRYRADNREFRRVRARSVRGNAVYDFPDDVLLSWLADPDAVFDRPGAVLLKDSRSSTVARVVIPTRTGPREIVVKRFRWKGWLAAGKNLFRASPALRSWLLGHGLRDRGLPTPRPLAVLHRYRAGCPAEGYIAFETVPDSVGLPEAVAALPSGSVRVRRQWAERIGRLLREMHDKQVRHRDLKAPNILMQGAVDDPDNAVPVLIDLVGATASRPVPRATRVRDLARLNASFLAGSTVGRSDRLRVLRGYLRWGLHGRGDWKTWWTAIHRVTERKVAKNERAGRVLS